MTTTAVMIEDKVAGKPPSTKYQLLLPGDRLTVRDLIHAYVADQVERFNETPIHRSSRHQGSEERVLNPDRSTKRSQRRECEVEYQRAIKAFCDNSYFLLVNGHQVGDLDEEIAIESGTTISFLRLTPLVGG